MINWRSVIFFSILLYAATGFGQRFYSRNYTVNDGLPSNIIHSIVKDSRGILWIGTGGGLCRFDGTKFQVYNTTHGLVGDNVYSITEDKNGDLWIGCMAAGISRFDGKKFHNYSIKQGLVSNNVRVVWYSKKFDVLMIGTNDGCNAMDHGRFVTFKVKDWDSGAEKVFVTGFMDGKNSIHSYAFAYPSMVDYEPGQKRFSHSGQIAWGASVSPLIMRNGDTISGYHRDGIIATGKKGTTLFDGMGQVLGLAEDDGGNVWIAGWADPLDAAWRKSGLFRYNGKSIEPFSKKVNITDRSVWTVYYDTCNHLLWVGTLNQGLYKIPDPSFTMYDNDFFHQPSLHVNDLLFDREGALWIASDENVIRMHPDDSFKIFEPSILNKAGKNVMRKNFPVMNSFYFDRQGSYEKYENLIRNGQYSNLNPYQIINTQFGNSKIVQAGSLYNPKEYEIRLKSFLEDSLAIPFLYSCLGSDSKGNIYVSNYLFLHRFQASLGFQPIEPEYLPAKIGIFAINQTDTLLFGDSWHKGIFAASLLPKFKFAFHPYYGWEEEKGPPNVICMALNGNEIWCGSRTEGLFRVANGKIDAFNTRDSSLPKIIPAICFDNRGNVIVGGINGTIIIARTEGGTLKVLNRISAENGLTGNTIRWMIVKSDNKLYVGTNHGLNVIDLDRLYRKGSLHIRFYDQDEGYYDYSGTTAVIDKEGSIWVGTDLGLMKVNTQKLNTIIRQSSTLQIFSTEVNHIRFTFPDEVQPDSWTGYPVPDWKFAHDQNNLTFFFSASDFSTDMHLRYRYLLRGLHAGWSKFSSDPKAVFTNLDPGIYILEAECYNISDNLKISRVRYPFTICRPWYATWWFLAVSGILFFLAGFFVYHWRIRRIKERERARNELMLDVSRMEMRALQAQLNPHFIFNVINSMQSYILNDDIDRSLYYLNVFSKLIRRTLENASKEFIPAVEELDYLKYYVEIEKMRFEGLFDYEIRIGPKIPVETTLIPPMIAQLFVENAIKHGLRHRDSDGVLIIELTREHDRMFRLVVQDNGVGRNRSKEVEQVDHEEHKSFGLYIISERIRILNQTHATDAFKILLIDLKDREGFPAGVRAEFWFPEL